MKIGNRRRRLANFTYLARLFEAIDTRIGYDYNFDITSITSMF